ncbi:MAG: hypothetical protein COV47_01200 [Candidatus Diapherotrites archaeon CG11_big_fil_rev_8_21_14_0_20_37_9]|nr:MAG: hypothetical protein COV47_01200 [Candidatus Diapherotrites archaeon CG11_big_fil_rev_8_21_14_0_20_37_9]
MLNSGIEVEKAYAQKVRLFLQQNGFFDGRFRVISGSEKVVFPCIDMPKKDLVALKKLHSSVKKISVGFSGRPRKPRNMKQALFGKLSEKELSFVPSAFDSLGNVAIIEVPKELKGKEKLLGEALLEVHSSFASVYLKTGAHQGIFREEPVKLVAGKRKKFAIYKEHGCTFHISIGKVFFSPRLSTERKRISGKIKKGEHVAALFAGVGPFPIVFAKNSKMEKAIAIELNPQAVKDMEENVLLNKVSGKVEPVLGDVKKLAEKYAGKFDRAVMPLPKGGENFLQDAIKFIKPSGGIVHYYQFTSRKDPYTIPLQQIKSACSSLGKKFRVVEKRKVREFAPDIIQIVIDFRVQ